MMIMRTEKLDIDPDLNVRTQAQFHLNTYINLLPLNQVIDCLLST